MRFTIRDVFWSATVVALIAAWLAASRQQRAIIRLRDAKLQEVEFQISWQESQAELLAVQADNAEQTLLDQRREILDLRQLIKQSINDQRDWFELEVDSNRILAVSPATADGAEVTVETVRYAEAATGLDGSKLRHFLQPIRQLRRPSGSFEVQERTRAHGRQ